MHIINFAADENYKTQTSGTPGYEASKQVWTGRRRLVNVTILNNSAALAYVKLQDTANGGTDNGPAQGYVIAANSLLTLAFPQGKRFELGLFIKGYTDAAFSAAAGAILHLNVDYMAYL